jgi:hypothetical protein
MSNDASFSPTRAAGITIIVAAVLSIGFMLSPPRVHAHGMSDFVVAVRQELLVNGVVHGTLIALMGVLAAGFSVVTTRLDSVWARIALAAYAIGVVSGMAAASINGLIVPEFVLHFGGKSESVLEALRPVLSFCHSANQVCSRMWVVASAIALVFWSIALTQRKGVARTIGILGIVLGFAPLVALAIGYLPMDIHGVLAFIVTQTVWSIAVGVLLIRGRI